MRERTPVSSWRSGPHNPQDGAEHLLIQQETARDFRAGDVDLDCLAEAIRELLRPESDVVPEVRTSRKPDLLSERRRASHVVGAKT
jgi:hypothetical protein